MGTTATIAFSPESWARSYAKSHYETDPGITDIFFIPSEPGEREVRLVEVNDQLAERAADPSEAWILTIDDEGQVPHKLAIVDVTPNQWIKILSGQLSLPTGWSLSGHLRMAQD